MNFYFRSRWHWWRRRTQRRTRRTIKNHQFGVFLQFSTINLNSRLPKKNAKKNNKITNQIFRQIVMRQKNLPSSTTTNLRRCVLHEKKTNQNIRARSRVCFPVRDFPQNFCLPIMGVATSPPLFSVCLSACHAHVWTSLPQLFLDEKTNDWWDIVAIFL